MGPANKILTVAYGTFSCTLEGFDDPFSAMTEIAEYFRDLAARDRSFGAEPATLDMAELRAIAERRGLHPVTARAGEDGIVLRAMEGDDRDEIATPTIETMSGDGREGSPDDTPAPCMAEAQVEAPDFRADAPESMAPDAVGTAEPGDIVTDADAGEDTLAADLAAILSAGLVAAGEGPDADSDSGTEARRENEEAAILPPNLRIRRVRRAGDASDSAASIVTPAAAHATRRPLEEAEADEFGDDADSDILGLLSFDDDNADGGRDGWPAADAQDVFSTKEGHPRNNAGGASPADASVRDMERLFAATDSRLSGEDTSRRLATISHLKAAVAARRADGPATDDEDAELEPYRADLASNVRPRRAVRPTEAPRAERPARPAPLMLVSEQRVDDAPGEDAEAAAPVHPHRAVREDEPEAPQAGGTDLGAFEEFASGRGATDLPAILEAAAFYTTRMTGQDTFTRPALLHLAAEACDELSREDGLRGFGQLLRDGRIRKVGRGAFALGDKSRHASGADLRTG